MNIVQNIDIQPTQHSRIGEIDFSHLPFGRIFSDHMLVADCINGVWQQPRIIPYGKMEMSPAASVLHYGQAIFEGMKAYRTADDRVVLFRPKDNFERLNKSAARMCMPEIPEDLFIQGLIALVNLDRNWVPSSEGSSLYIRPVYFATEECVGVKASESYRLVIITSPVGAYYAEPVNLLVTKDYVRAVEGGIGETKAAANYGASLYADKMAKSKGYHNVIWLDAKEHTYIEEIGTMNVFFVIDGKVITPATNGTILKGVTRNSCIRLLKDNGYDVEERRISIDEVFIAYRSGKLQEAFGAGTAATIAHVAKIGYNGTDMVLPPVPERKVSNWLLKTLTAIRTGQAPDPYGWITEVN